MSASLHAANVPAINSKHYELIKQNISESFQQAAPERVQALARGRREIERWHMDNPTLRVANKASWAAQNAVDKTLVQTKDARAFGAPLLQARLKEKYGVVDDVSKTWLRLYQYRKGTAGLPDPMGGTTVRDMSLLDLALQNFADHETYIEKDSAYRSQPDERGQFTIKPIHHKMTIAQFQTLCRDLDIGKQYLAHVKEAVQPAGAQPRQTLKEKVIANEKAMFETAAAMALAKGDISDNAYRVVTGMLSGKKGLTLVGKVTDYGDLSLLGTTLTGIVIFGAVPQQDKGEDPIVVYVPHDPDHPLKEYGSWKGFVRELARQLRENTVAPSSQMNYQQFFSQFVDQNQRGHFFAMLQSRLTTITWHEKPPYDQRPSWRNMPVEQPDLQYRRTVFTEDLAEHLYQRKTDKILKDARDIAVSTEDADSHARKAWWDNLLKIGEELFNVALMVVGPFVPMLGEVMMAYSAFQLGSEVIEGVVDLAKGQWADAIDHLVGVLESLAQMAAIGAGFAAGKPLLTKASTFFDGLLPVKLPDGGNRLWNPDLAPYEQKDGRVQAETRPQANGLHIEDGKPFLRVAEKHYEVSKDARTDQYRIQHPVRSDAYQPRVRLNGSGAYVIEVEQPRTWDDATLLRRIGPSVAEHTDAQLETARKISGTASGELRRMYVENRQPPVLLTDTLTRLDIDRDIQMFIEQMHSDDPQVYCQADPVTQLQVMTQYGMWPKNASMRVIDSNGKLIWEHSEPKAPPGKKLIVQLHERQVHNGDLLGTVMAALDHNGTAVILDLPVEVPSGSLAARTKALRKRIVEVTERERQTLFDAAYASHEYTSDTLTKLVSEGFPDLPVRGIEHLLAKASLSERKIMRDENRLPLRLKRIAQELELEARTARGYEGFYRDSLVSADTERLALNALRIHSDALGDVRIEIRDARFDGELICKAGPREANVVRILVKGKNNTYEVRDADDLSLHPATDLYRAILQALPDLQRRQLGYLTSEGPAFKQWLLVKTEAPSQRRIALDPRNPPPPVPTQDLLLLRGPMLSKAPRTLEERVADLYPHFNEREVAVFVKSLADSGDADFSLTREEKELSELRDRLSRWRHDQIVNWGHHSSDFILTGGKYLADQLMECFERRSEVFGKRYTHPDGGYALDLATDAADYDLERWWKQLPGLETYVARIRSLSVDNIRLKSDSTGLLNDFHALRQLSARNCELTRLPKAVAKMQTLQTLRLSENRIQLLPDDVQGLRKLTCLETLRLDDNPLQANINVELMPRLKVLTLNNTGISTWPEGLFKQRRPRGFFLDMQQNPLSVLPKVSPGSDEAFIIARTRLYISTLSEANRSAYENYRTSVGISPHTYYSEKANQELIQWPVFEDHNQTERNPGLGTYRPEAWSDLAKEPYSKGFFTVIEKLRQSADYLAGGDAQLDLSDRVWRTIDAAYLNPGLRDELFIMSSAPTTCADAGAQLFNNMGVKVLAAEAHASATSATELENSMVTLGRGAARLEAVAQVARADVRSRSGRPDEVEVHLAYETGLAERLDLPWQSRNMLFRIHAGVTDETITVAYDTIIANEAGNGLVDLMLDQSIWSEYLEDTYPGEFERNANTFGAKAGQLEDLRMAQEQWADAEDLSEAEQALLKQQIKTLCAQIPVSEALIFTGAAMTEETYGQLYVALGESRKELGRTLTRKALKSAGL